MFIISHSLYQVGVPVYTEGTDVKPSEIAKHCLEEAKKKKIDVVIVDTAGRLQVIRFRIGNVIMNNYFMPWFFHYMNQFHSIDQVCFSYETDRQSNDGRVKRSEADIESNRSLASCGCNDRARSSGYLKLNFKYLILYMKMRIFFYKKLKMVNEVVHIYELILNELLSFFLNFFSLSVVLLNFREILKTLFVLNMENESYYRGQ